MDFNETNSHPTVNRPVQEARTVWQAEAAAKTTWPFSLWRAASKSRAPTNMQAGSCCRLPTAVTDGDVSVATGRDMSKEIYAACDWFINNSFPADWEHMKPPS